jgi:hypothetical protein
MKGLQHRIIGQWIGGCLLLLSLLAGCSGGTPKFLAGDLNGVNHTSAAINYFTVNGYGGPNISPYGYGGGYCCVLLPSQWVPGLMLEVKWETDPDPYKRLKRKVSGYGADPEAYAQHKANYRKHTAIIELPPYEEDGLCALEVHFLSCNQIKLSTSCWGYPSPNSPIKEPLEMKEPAVCQI